MTWPPKDAARDELRAHMIAKHGAAKVGQITKSRKKPVQREAKVQRSIVEFLDLALPEGGDVFWSATLNGVKLDGKIKERLKAEGLRRGVLDLVFIPLANHPRLGVAHWVEVKSDTGRPTPEQARLLAVLVPGGLGALCRTVEEVQASLMVWGFRLRAKL